MLSVAHFRYSNQVKMVQYSNEWNEVLMIAFKADSSASVERHYLAPGPLTCGTMSKQSQYVSLSAIVGIHCW